MQEHLESQVQKAFESKQPRHNLRALAEQLKAQGQAQIEIYLAFAAPLLVIPSAEEEIEQEWRFDALQEVLDEIWGWCSEHRKLFPGQNISDEELEEHRKRFLEAENS